MSDPSSPSPEQHARSVAIDPRVPALVPGFDAPFFQAGLAGYSDGAMRLIARRHGCPFCVTEALLDRTLINGGKGRTREDPDVLAEECGAGELEDNRAAGLHDHPIAGQIIGSHPEEMARGAALLATMGYEVIDVNLACPVRKIRRRNRGGHLLAHAQEAIAILREVRGGARVDPHFGEAPRAYDDSPEMAAEFERIFNAAYELGFAWTTVHCRTVKQKYVGPGRWSFLTELVQRHPDRIIFGSGDVWTVRDIFSMLQTTGVAAVSVARGCIGNPWIFQQARALMSGRPALPPTLSEQRRALLEHFDLAVALHGEQAASRMMRKFGIKFSQHHPHGEDVRSGFIRCRSIVDWRAVVDHHYGAIEPGERDDAAQPSPPFVADATSCTTS